MSKYEWLLFLHVSGAFLFLGAAVASLFFLIAAQLRRRPSEAAFLLRVQSFGVIGAAFAVGGLLLLVFGLWLVDDAGYGYGDGWVVWSLILFIASSVFGGVGGTRIKPARATAERLAASGDEPSRELKAAMWKPWLIIWNYGAALLAFGVLALMIWKPGAL